MSTQWEVLHLIKFLINLLNFISTSLLAGSTLEHLNKKKWFLVFISKTIPEKIYWRLLCVDLIAFYSTKHWILIYQTEEKKKWRICRFFMMNHHGFSSDGIGNFSHVINLFSVICFFFFLFASICALWHYSRFVASKFIPRYDRALYFYLKGINENINFTRNRKQKKKYQKNVCSHSLSLSLSPTSTIASAARGLTQNAFPKD